MSDYSIGVLGGMGTYATIKMFQQYAEIFPAEKEWERPRIIIDNNCTMPSRVRAALYNEKREELIQSMAKSISLLIGGGVSRIILACNTSHLFLPDIYELVPQAKSKILNIIDVCVREIVKRNVGEIYLMASEGTIHSGVYQEKLREAGIKCITPLEEEFSALRLCIEAVKQNKYDDEIKSIFLNYINSNKSLILGCTELPVLYDIHKSKITAINVFNPLEIALCALHEEFIGYYK